VYYLRKIHQIYIYTAFTLDLLVELMLSFDVSAIDIVLAVAVIILLCLYVAKKLHAPKTELKSQVEETQPFQENPKAVSKTLKSKSNGTKSQTSFQNCVHDFGYLRTLPKNTSFPDECFGCSKVTQCLFQKTNPKIPRPNTLTQSHKTVKSQILCNSVGKSDARL